MGRHRVTGNEPSTRERKMNTPGTDFIHVKASPVVLPDVLGKPKVPRLRIPRFLKSKAKPTGFYKPE